MHGYLLVNMVEKDIEKIKERKMEEMRQKAQQNEEETNNQSYDDEEIEKEALLKSNLTEGARRRLKSVKMAKPDFGESVEKQLLVLAQSGRLGDNNIDEDTMKELLRDLNEEDSNDYNIKRR